MKEERLACRLNTRTASRRPSSVTTYTVSRTAQQTEGTHGKRLAKDETLLHEGHHLQRFRRAEKDGGLVANGRE